MAIPKFYELFTDVLQILKEDADNAISNEQLQSTIANRRGLTDEDKTHKAKSDTPVYKSRVAWARSYLKVAGLVEYPKRGLTKITSDGLKILDNLPNPFNLAYLRKNYASVREFISPSKGDEDISLTAESDLHEQTPQERMDFAFNQINAVLKSDILNEIVELSPTYFEHLVLKLLEKMGYGGLLDGEGIVTAKTGDGGIDGIIREDKLGFSNIYFQAKRYALDRTVNTPEIQGFVGAIANKNGKGLFVTTAKFSSGAKNYAQENHIVLVDGDKLADLMIEYGVGVSTQQVYEIKKPDLGFFAEQD